MKKVWIVLLVLAFVGPTSLGQLSGPLSGTLGSGTYQVVDTIEVELGDTLWLLPGTTFIFDGPYPFWIHGTILAEGTATDSIAFTTDISANPGGWRGLRFSGQGSSASQLTHCRIEHGRGEGDWPYHMGGGLYCDESSPCVTNCDVISNSADYGGGAFCGIYSIPIFVGCVFANNSSSYGGGLYVYYSSPNLTNCTIRSNTSMGGAGVFCSHSSPSFTSCNIAENWAERGGGGVECRGSSSPTFANCTFVDNSALVDQWAAGGAAYCYGGSATFTSCALVGNRAAYAGGGVSGQGASITLTSCSLNANQAGTNGGGVSGVECSIALTNCSIIGNMATYGGGLHYYYCVPSIINCTMSRNVGTNCASLYCASSPLILNSTIVAFSCGAGVYFEGSAESQPEHCDIFGSSDGDILFYNDDPSEGPPGIGQLVTTNANGDSCDVYMNIFLDPLFVDTASGDLHLGDYSPCIGAADPTNPPPFDLDGNPRPNPPGSLPDIGAYEHWRDVPLPVQLTTFEAIAGDGQVTLHWRTESELDNDHFILYKRKAGEQGFNRLAEIPGHGTTTEPHDYEYVDRFVRNGINYEYQISDVDIAGRETIHEQIVSATPSAAAIPMEFALHAPYPNPFNPVTTIRYNVKGTGLVSLKIFDLLGREAATLVYGTIPAGFYSIEWDAGDLPSGVYLCRMEAVGFQETRKVVLLK